MLSTTGLAFPPSHPFEKKWTPSSQLILIFPPCALVNTRCRVLPREPRARLLPTPVMDLYWPVSLVSISVRWWTRSIEIIKLIFERLLLLIWISINTNQRALKSKNQSQFLKSLMSCKFPLPSRPCVGEVAVEVAATPFACATPPETIWMYIPWSFQPPLSPSKLSWPSPTLVLRPLPHLPFVWLAF